MNIRHRCRLLVVIATLMCATQLRALERDKPTESKHVRGPKGLEGWTLNGPLPDRPNEEFPFTLVLARNGRVVRKIEGSPFIWNWIFWSDGKQVAYESGPLHFSLQCTLADVKTGKEVASYDCFHGIPADAPDWLKTLEQPR
ncbi:hypothetical protein P8935_12625 [Telmatobacter sp. DSM 110680]|uniref:Uncharacterized protein n=1 Tax=Telmatobacter sp. DSM 110680 TaxID=3036704 RepID=A0AAU7DDL4_9BACT